MEKFILWPQTHLAIELRLPYPLGFCLLGLQTRLWCRSLNSHIHPSSQNFILILPLPFLWGNISFNGISYLLH